MYKIESGIPIPVGNENKTGIIGTIRKMGIGDSVKLGNKKQIEIWREVARQYGFKITTK